MNQPELTISLLGGLAIAQNGTAVTGFASRKADALLVYLACNPRPHPRETIATLFWPDNDQSRALANLSVILTSLRKQLGDYLLADRHTVAFNSEMDSWLDVVRFEQAIEQAQARQQDGKITRTVAVQLQTAVSYYKGDFLAGFNLRGVPEFEAWVLLEQERLRQMMLEALATLITFHQQRGHFADGIRHARQLLALDPLQEETHRQLMLLYALDNQRPAALAHYEQCVAILDEELGVEPDDETTALYAKIKDDKVTGQEKVTLSPGHPVTQATAGSTPRHNLPAPATTFIGREAELAQIESWLGQPDDRLLTIIGPGGMGKTRLAQEAARGQIGVFADGVWIISLVPQTNLAGLVTAVADTIGFTLGKQEAPATQLLNHLTSQEMLLVLDNLEHLLTPALRDFLSQLTRQAPELRLIITSRERLNVQAERLLELDGLPFPASGDPLSVGGKRIADSGLPLTDYPSVQLFTNRVQQVKVDFDVEKQGTAVTELCQLVGGLPLALELAATWTRILSVAEIVAEIQRGLDVLTTSLHDVPARHRSLLAVIESSWRMLAAEEQALFRKLAVFRGGFTRAAAQQVVQAALPQLMALADRSFLRLDADQRFRRHPLLLQFAQAQLAAQPAEKAQTEAVHARFFADLVQSREPMLTGSEGPEALAAIGADLENIRAAWQWGIAAQDSDLLETMITGFSRFFVDRSRFLEGTALFEESLAQVNQQTLLASHEPVLAKMKVELGRFLHENGRFPEAETVLQEALQLIDRHDLPQTRIICLRQLGVVLDDQGRREEAQHCLEEALQRCRLAGDTDEMSVILNALANTCVSAGQYEQARTYFDEAMALAKEAGNALRVAILHSNIGIIALRQKDNHEAIHQWQLARQGFKQLDNQIGLANTSHNIAMAFAELEQYDEALQNVQQAHAVYERIGQRRGLAGSLAVMGSIYRKQGKRRQARQHYNEALLLSLAVGVTWVSVGLVVEVAELAISYEDWGHAVRLLTFAIQHPAIQAPTRERAQKLLDELKVELHENLLAEMATVVTNLTLDDLVAELTNA